MALLTDSAPTDDANPGVRELVAHLLGDSLTKNGVRTRVLHVSGAPLSGKSTLSYETFVSSENAQRVREGRSYLIVSHRIKADELSNKAVAAVGNSVVSRPVKTLVALAFDMLKKDRAARDLTPPKLLDGAEQDQLIRGVLERHVRHVRGGDDEQCSSCALLKSYFSLRQATEDSTQVGGRTTVQIFEQMMTPSFAAQLRDMFARLSELHFDIGQSAELNECETALGQDARQRVEWDLATALRAEYAAAVSAEYPNEFRVDNSFLLVAAQNSVEHAVEWSAKAAADEHVFCVPEVVIVDDAQELTLAGFSFLQTLSEHGCRLLLVGNDDESVQTFRGAYPEVLSVLEDAESGMNAVHVQLPSRLLDERRQAPNYRVAVASRVSLAVGSVMVNDAPLPQRPGKLVAADATSRTPDASLRGRLFRSPAEELDDLVWQVKSRHLETSAHWDDCAVIAHDNATLQTIGKRFSDENIPVSYSSVSRPLKEESVVQGLLAMLTMVDAIADTVQEGAAQEDVRRQEGAAQGDSATQGERGAQEQDAAAINHAAVDPASLAAAKASIDKVVNSPLFSVMTSAESERPIRLKRITAALASLAVLETLALGAQDSEDGMPGKNSTDIGAQGAARFMRLREEWQRLSGVEDESPIGVEGFFSLLIFARPEVRDELLTLIDSILSRGQPRDGAPEEVRRQNQRFSDAEAGKGSSVKKRSRGYSPRYADVAVLARMVDAVWSAAHNFAAQRDAGVYAALWYVWDACDVAQRWQERALSDSVEGRTANRLLDTVMRLFDHVTSDDPVHGGAEESIADFIERISNLEIEADSLAKVAPVSDAVTLATPAGISGTVKKYVWIPSLQQDVWPNLAPRNTLFGAEALADTVLSRRLAALRGPAGDGGQSVILDSTHQRLATLYSELKSLLVALTRASECVTLSAVQAETTVPSEFLYAFVPELFAISQAAQSFTEVGSVSSLKSLVPGARSGAETDAARSQPEDESRANASVVSRGGLDMTERGLIALSRAQLARYFAAAPNGIELSTQQLPPEISDAAETLAYLTLRGTEGADPAGWSFASTRAADSGEADSAGEGEAGFETSVTLSPSSVDRIWQCPLKWAMENKYNGPSSSSPATSFGTLIHNCAEDATRWGLDRSAGKDELADHMLEFFRGQRVQQESVDSVHDRYIVAQQDRKAKDVLSNIATYFVESRSAFYGIDTQGNPPKNELPPAGELRNAEAERSFRARFSLNDIVPMVRSALGDDAATTAEVAAALTALAEGFDKDFSQEAAITLGGRIDRLEYRERDGERVVNVVDYKTGQAHNGPAIFSDLQLVCYQLGLLFPLDDAADSDAVGNGAEEGVSRPVSPSVSQPLIAERSVLFDVEKGTAPAMRSNVIEATYQPALFRSTKEFNTEYVPRPGVPHIGSLFKDAQNNEEAFGALDRLREAAAAENNDQLMWCVSMIARVFYAAGYKQAHRFVPKRGAACTYCAFKGICPAWPEESTTVMGGTHGTTRSERGE
jgi:superfamily I DNA/RNA helicase